MKAPFAYYGGKMGMARRIVDLMPAHKVYMEPFFGCGAVLFAKPPSAFEIVNDIDRALTTFFRVLRNRREELELACILTPHCRVEFNAADLDEDDLDDLEMARRFWTRVNQSFAKTSGRQTGWSITTARSASVSSSILSRIGRFAQVAERLVDVSIEQRDAAGLIERLATDDTLVYADPPYLNSSRRTGRRGSAAKDYRFDTCTEDDHRRLAEVLTTTKASVLLSGYNSPLYEELYGSWDRREFAVTNHSSNAVTDVRGARVEVVWANYDLDGGRLELVARRGET